MWRTEDLHVASLTPLPSPREIKTQFPLTAQASETVVEGRTAISEILLQQDPRLLVIVGPCSLHDRESALEYGKRLSKLQAELGDRLVLVMRTYFEKPRTNIGWKGLINDPKLDGSCDVAQGLLLARELLLEINGMGLPTATEFLDPIVPQYISDLITWAAIGARTTESQTHREMASGLSMPVGFKNSTEGKLDVAINAMLSSRQQHYFFGIDQNGQTCIVNTLGNTWGHIILRGGREGPNYSAEHVEETRREMEAAGLPNRIMVDCSHANSSKDYKRQHVVLEDVVAQRVAGNAGLIGVMLESNLAAGSQPFTSGAGGLQHGVSITDPCIGWDETEALLHATHAALAEVGV